MHRAAALLLLIVLVPCAAQATPPGTEAIKKWHTMDKCSRDAQAAFPDYTPESNAKRDAKLKDCLARQNLPPRAPQQ